MTPAERLRAAAQLARETAEAAQIGAGMDWFTVEKLGFMSQHQIDIEDAAQLSLWSPPVALAVAAWLEAEARAFDAYMDRQLDPERRFGSIWLATAQERHEHALAVADALLQTQPVKP